MGYFDIDLFTKIAGIFGFVISFCLAVIKIVEFRRDRFQIIVSPSLTSDMNIGNTVTLINPTSRPVVVIWWNLRWKKKFLFKKNIIEEIECGDPLDSRTFTIASHDIHNLYFNDQDHFDWGYTMSKFGILYLDLKIAGRRCVTSLKVYDPRS